MESNTYSSIEDEMSALPPVTILFIAVNVLIFLFAFGSLILSRDQNLFTIGSLDQIKFWEGEYWRIISSNFLHKSIDHLGGNMILLYICGRAVEHFVGGIKVFFLYFMGGIMGGIFTFLFVDQQVSSVGASDCCFALFGAMSVAYWNFNLELSHVDKRVRNISIIVLIYLIYLGFTSPKVNNAAHVGGALMGVIFGLAFMRKRIDRSGDKVSKS